MERIDAIKQAIELIANPPWNQVNPRRFDLTPHFNPEWGLETYDIFSPENEDRTEDYFIVLYFSDQTTVKAFVEILSEDAIVHILSTQETFTVEG